MEVIINEKVTHEEWKVESGDIVTITETGKEKYYYIVIEVEDDEFMVANLNNVNFKKFETISISCKDEYDIKSEYYLASKHNNVKVEFSW